MPYVRQLAESMERGIMHSHGWNPECHRACFPLWLGSSRILFVLSGKHQFVYHFLKMNNSRTRNKNSMQLSRRNKRKGRQKPIPRPVPITVTYNKSFVNGPSQYSDMASYLSQNGQPDTLTLATRYNAPYVTWKSGKLYVEFTQPVDTVITYRFGIFHLLSRYVMTGSYAPITFFTPASTTSNFEYVLPYLPRDQSVPYRLVFDTQFVLDTTFGHDSLTTKKTFYLPEHTVYYDPDDSNGLTGLGLYIPFVLTNATHTDGDYLCQFICNRKYTIHF
jgi:hypothetical protein